MIDMSKQITMNLSTSSVQNAIKELHQYQQDLNRKCEVFCQRLAEKGIEVAKENTGGYGKYITFSVEVTDRTKGCTALMVATNTGIIHSEWKMEDGSIKSADISPLLMCEFGSGLKAVNPQSFFRGGHLTVGTGTFPGQTHAKDPNGWWWKDLEDNWHHSYGVTPKMPMYHASMEMLLNIRKIAKEVFGS